MNSGTPLIQTPKGTEESVHISELSLFQELNCMQELFLGKEKVSLLGRCLHFRGVLRERFHGQSAYAKISLYDASV